ncbi:uncharacterized protein LOC131037338 isoform X3 [Cryptomeria japonica]|uniref:uncharacterized protein LOC131037338 isoform X3 n=1 Tax=Cryptomeria japonica TaxID=3369 RepID=UPI0025AD9387|nr:uncharacterized protein LOC131037338 isoform X3 [Cryptomeria japonica]
MDASSPMNPPNSHGTMDESSDSDSSLISFSSCASDDIDDSFSSTSSDGPLYEMDSLRANLPFNCKFLLDCWPTGESVVEVLPLVSYGGGCPSFSPGNLSRLHLYQR